MLEVNSARIRSLLLERSMSIRDLAKAAKLTEVTTAKALRGAKANIKTVGKLATALGVRGEEILMEAN